ncbi:hypothetical protein F7725_013235, partial [Dissostichus mawsoni]
MLEKLSRCSNSEGELFNGKSRWTSAAVAVVLLGVFASSCWAEEASCHGAYDLYFVLDRSGSVANDWVEIYSFVKNLTDRFPQNESLVIVFSARAEVLLPLTGDGYEIEQGLKRLRAVKPAGETYMHEGIKEASAQIQAQKTKSSSIILALTDGKLETYIHELTVKEADEARKFGARVYCVGIKDFDEQQLADVADTKDQVFPVKDGFQALKGIVNSILKRSCTEILSVEPPVSSPSTSSSEGTASLSAAATKASSAALYVHTRGFRGADNQTPPPKAAPTNHHIENKWYTPIKGRLDALCALLGRQYDRVSLMRPSDADK